MTALGALLGALLAVGAILVVSGLIPTEVRPKPPTHGRPKRPLPVRNLAGAVAGALVVGLITHWPVGAVGGALIGWSGPKILGGSRRSRRADTDKLRALASWASLLRDGFAGIGMLQSTIAATEHVAPRAIRPQVALLCARMRSSRPGSAERALRLFAGELADETADMMVTALLLAAKGTGTNLADMLSTLADQANKEVAARLEVESKRAEVLMGRRIVLGAVVTFSSFMVIFRGDYLRPFGTVVGQFVVAIIVALFAASAWYMDRLSQLLPAQRTMQPERLLTETPAAAR